MRLLRTLARSPGFTAVAVVTLALAIGTATAVFSVVDAVVLRGLPYGNASQLRTVYQRSDDGDVRLPSFPTFSDWQAAAATVHDAIDGFAFVRGDGVFIGDDPEREIGAYVTPGFFHLMETPPLLGRVFLPDEEQIGAPRVAVLSYDFFRRRFGGDRSIIGTLVTIDSVPTTVVGVMPSGFAFPNFGATDWLPPAVWQPIAVYQATHNTLTLRGLHVDSRAVLRMRSDADSARVAAAMQTIARRIAAAYPRDEAHWTSVEIRSLPREMFGQLWSTLALVSGAIGLVLLLACASVANLMLIRASARSREFAVRVALGAGRWRVARQPLAEAATIAGAGGALGLGLAAVLVGIARPFAATRLPFATHIGIDPRAVLFTMIITALTTLLVAALAARHAGRQDLIDRLRGSAASSGAGSAESRVRNGLVAMQFALAITLLTGAGLLIQSVRRLSSVPLGYDPAGLIEFAVAPPAHRYESPEEAAALYARIIDAVRAVPSVQRVAAAGGALLETRVETSQQSGTAATPLALYHPISNEYLRTMGVRIVAGRDFTDEDMRSPSGLLVSHSLARQLWPGGRAIGQRITIFRQSQARPDFGQPITLPVIGVVADYHAIGAESDPPPQVFLPYTLEVWPWMHFVARGGTSPSVLKSVERAVREVEPALTFYGKPSFDTAGRTPSIADPRMFVTGLLSAFAMTALLLAAVGLYGVVAYAVTQRTREIGIRIAIGATPGDVVRLLLRQAAMFVGSGMAVGVLAALGAARVLRALLFETATTDVTTLLVVPVILGVVAAVASGVPALRASRTDPTVVMRAE
ncbi:MAG TPA: ABC transporter permease [Gemmatimonadaceae bacterium]|nr:ABC transporter permease [Gemmatimonadaceae bacterium]